MRTTIRDTPKVLRTDNYQEFALAGFSEDNHAVYMPRFSKSKMPFNVFPFAPLTLEDRVTDAGGWQLRPAAQRWEDHQLFQATSPDEDEGTESQWDRDLAALYARLTYHLRPANLR